eukprot:TRINITY_DN678_c0_g1_i2.p1 TRINITY_DN678_c0_g1~~TRINITY_DN678_c0_g1_i2.p1  ORF type:complete len:320 (+),score=44.23 TRINITY_DN678_c0_g1_i2:353-1312(+)
MPSSNGMKTLAKLAKSVEDGNYYEAQQMYKTMLARYMAAKKYEEALDLVQSGAVMQLKHGQVTCGVELGVLLVETLVMAKVPVGGSSLERVKAVFHEFARESVRPPKASRDSQCTAEEKMAIKTRVDGCGTFVRAALKWSIDFGSSKRGAPELHDLIAEYIWEQSYEPDMGRASQHFIRGQHPEVFASALVECMTQCFSGEADLVIARGVLQYLGLGNLRDANRLWEETKKIMDAKDSIQYPDSPLMHFIKFLLLTLERDALPLFRMLRENYKASLERDPCFDEYLDEIGERFYGLRRKNGVQSMLGDLMKMFTGESGM